MIFHKPRFFAVFHLICLFIGIYFYCKGFFLQRHPTLAKNELLQDYLGEIKEKWFDK